MNVNVNLNDVKTFIESDKFIQFLLNNSTDLGTPVFITQTLLEKINELQKEEK